MLSLIFNKGLWNRARVEDVFLNVFFSKNTIFLCWYLFIKPHENTKEIGLVVGFFLSLCFIEIKVWISDYIGGYASQPYDSLGILFSEVGSCIIFIIVSGIILNVTHYA